MTQAAVRPGSLCFEQVEVGQVLEGRLTVTESHMVLAAGIFGDFAPLYVDAEFASQTRFGACPAPGALLVGIMGGVLSKWFGKYALGVQEQHAEFKAPVLADATVATRWEVEERHPDASLGGGVVILGGECRAARDVLAVVARVSLVVGASVAGPPDMS